MDLEIEDYNFGNMINILSIYNNNYCLQTFEQANNQQFYH